MWEQSIQVHWLDSELIYDFLPYKQSGVYIGTKIRHNLRPPCQPSCSMDWNSRTSRFDRRSPLCQRIRLDHDAAPGEKPPKRAGSLLCSHLPRERWKSLSALFKQASQHLRNTAHTSRLLSTRSYQNCYCEKEERFETVRSSSKSFSLRVLSYLEKSIFQGLGRRSGWEAASELNTHPINIKWDLLRVWQETTSEKHNTREGLNTTIVDFLNNL